VNIIFAGRGKRGLYREGNKRKKGDEKMIRGEPIISLFGMKERTYRVQKKGKDARQVV